MKFYTVEGKKKSIFNVYAIYYICMVVFCLIRIFANSGLLQFSDTAYSIIIQIGTLFLLPFVLYMIMLKVKPREVFEHCNFSKININVILISLGLGVLCFIINVAVSSLFNGMIAFSGYRAGSGSGGSADWSTGNFFLQLLLVAVLPAFCEEFLHRGILLQGTKHAGFKRAIVISSLLFALLHFNVQQVFYAFVIGLILGFVAVVSKNIFPAMIIHFVNNAIATYLSFAEQRGWFMGDIYTNLEAFLKNNNMFVVFFTVAVVMVIVVILLCLFIWLLYKQSIIRKVDKAVSRAYSKFSVLSRNERIKIGEDHEVIIDLLESNTLLNLDFKVMDNPVDIVMPKEKSRYKVSKKDIVFLWGAIVMGVLVTVFTYTWGLF